MQTAVLSRQSSALDLAIRIALALLSAFGIWRAARWLLDARSAEMIDVDVYQTAGSALLHGHDIYGQAGTAHGLPYLYTPFGAGLFAPLSALGAETLHVAWTALILGALYVICRQSLDYAAPSDVTRYGALASLAAFGASLMLEPIAQNLKFGQINILITAAIMLDLRGRTGKLPQGLLIGLAAAIKLTPLLFAVYLLFAGKRQAAKVAAITFGASIGLGLLFAFGASITYWTDVAYDTSRVGVAFVTNQSMNGFFARILGGPEHVTFLFKIPIALVGLVGLVVAIRAARTARTGRAMLGDLLCGLTALLVSPISWSHHWVWVIPVLIWLLFAPDRPKLGAFFAAIGFVLFSTSPIQWVPRGNGHEYHYDFLQTLQGNAYLIGGLVFLMAIAHRVWRNIPAAES